MQYLHTRHDFCSSSSSSVSYGSGRNRLVGWKQRPRERNREMGRLHLSYLDGRMYTCKYCYTHLALVDDIISKSFHCNNRKAYLFNKVVNVSLGEKAERMMMTGLHTVADTFCIACGSIVGWKYEVAPDRIQKYKEGKYILVMRKVVDFDGTNFGVSSESQAGGSDADDAGYYAPSIQRS